MMIRPLKASEKSIKKRKNRYFFNKNHLIKVNLYEF